MYINVSYKFHRTPDRQSRFIPQVHDLLGQPSYILSHIQKSVSNFHLCQLFTIKVVRAQWLSVRMLNSRPKGRGFETHRRHCVVSLSKNINPSLILVQSRKTRPFITERLLMGHKESNQTNKTNNKSPYAYCTIC